MCAIHLRHPFLLYLIYQYIACRLVGVLKSSHLQNMGNHKKWFVLYPCCLTLPGWVVLQSISSSMVLWCLDCGPSANSKHPRRLKSNTKHKTTGSSKNSKFNLQPNSPQEKAKTKNVHIGTPKRWCCTTTTSSEVSFATLKLLREGRLRLNDVLSSLRQPARIPKVCSSLPGTTMPYCRILSWVDDEFPHSTNLAMRILPCFVWLMTMSGGFIGGIWRQFLRFFRALEFFCKCPLQGSFSLWGLSTRHIKLMMRYERTCTAINYAMFGFCTGILQSVCCIWAYAYRNCTNVWESAPACSYIRQIGERCWNTTFSRARVMPCLSFETRNATTSTGTSWRRPRSLWKMS